MNTQSCVTTITSVAPKNTAKGELYVIGTADGTEFSTFQGALANQAYSLINRPVELRYVEKIVTKPDGRSFTNRYYESAAPASNGQQAMPVGQVTFGQAPATAAPVSQFTAPAAPEGDREIKIMRQTATKVAAHLLPHLPVEERTPSGLLAMADFLVDYYQHGAGPSAPRTTADVYPADPGTELPPFTGDDDVPF